MEGTAADVTTAEGRESLVKLVSHFLRPINVVILAQALVGRAQPWRLFL